MKSNRKTKQNKPNNNKILYIFLVYVISIFNVCICFWIINVDTQVQ